jgi:hypothetical protein
MRVNSACHGLRQRQERDRFIHETLASARDSNVPAVLE